MDRRRVAVAIAAGLVVLFLLFPGSGIDRQPPECYSAFGYVVPCEGGVAVAAATAVVVGLALWAVGRRKGPATGA